MASGAVKAVEVDERIILHGISWERYQTLRELLDDIHGLRMTYLESTLEITRPSIEHERVKSLVDRLIGLYAWEKNIPLYSYGSTTFRKEASERGLEPDECYNVGTDLEDVPHIAVEIILNSGGIDKLSVYAGLGVPEVWFWRDGRITIHQLGDGRYQVQERSHFLPELDLVGLSSLSSAADQVDALRTWRDLLRQRI
jgi:Uma2 family endonuclease